MHVLTIYFLTKCLFATHQRQYPLKPSTEDDSLERLSEVCYILPLTYRSVCVCVQAVLTTMARFVDREKQGGPVNQAAAAAGSRQSCPTPCDRTDGSPPGSPSLGFSRQEHWSGLPFPSPMHESEVDQSCLTLSDPMDCSLPGSSIHGVFQARVLEWLTTAFSINQTIICQVIFFFS